MQLSVVFICIWSVLRVDSIHVDRQWFDRNNSHDRLQATTDASKENISSDTTSEKETDEQTFAAKNTTDTNATVQRQNLIITKSSKAALLQLIGSPKNPLNLHDKGLEAAVSNEQNIYNAPETEQELLPTRVPQLIRSIGRMRDTEYNNQQLMLDRKILINHSRGRSLLLDLYPQSSQLVRLITLSPGESKNSGNMSKMWYDRTSMLTKGENSNPDNKKYVQGEGKNNYRGIAPKLGWQTPDIRFNYEHVQGDNATTPPHRRDLGDKERLKEEAAIQTNEISTTEAEVNYQVEAVVPEGERPAYYSSDELRPIMFTTTDIAIASITTTKESHIVSYLHLAKKQKERRIKRMKSLEFRYDPANVRHYCSHTHSWYSSQKMTKQAKMQDTSRKAKMESQLTKPQTKPKKKITKTTPYVEAKTEIDAIEKKQSLSKAVIGEWLNFNYPNRLNTNRRWLYSPFFSVMERFKSNNLKSLADDRYYNLTELKKVNFETRPCTTPMKKNDTYSQVKKRIPILNMFDDLGFILDKQDYDNVQNPEEVHNLDNYFLNIIEEVYLKDRNKKNGIKINRDQDKLAEHKNFIGDARNYLKQMKTKEGKTVEIVTKKKFSNTTHVSNKKTEKPAKSKPTHHNPIWDIFANLTKNESKTTDVPSNKSRYAVKQCKQCFQLIKFLNDRIEKIESEFVE